MTFQLVSYIAPGAPATRRPASGGEPVLRPEIGFTPNWYHASLGIDFGKRWHYDPAYRMETRLQMAKELKRRFPGIPIGGTDDTDRPDVLSGVFGVLLVPAIYGVRPKFSANAWPNCEPLFTSVKEVYGLEPPDLHRNGFFCQFMEQLEWIHRKVGMVKGFIVGQGVLNSAFRLRGGKIFLDVVKEPKAARHLFQCITTTIIDVAKAVHEYQAQTGFEVQFFTISNCLVNMISPSTYQDLLLPFDVEIAKSFKSLGIHNCAWDASPYLHLYSTIPNVGYIDMGIESDLASARELFPGARRAVMYKTTDVREKGLDEFRKNLEHIAALLGPCDLVLADIDVDVPDEKIRSIYALCNEVSEVFEKEGSCWL